ncbi:hypothetical protein PTTG_00811, partial [Puccinia triticina 1-1 BBBD Race 1]
MSNQQVNPTKQTTLNGGTQTTSNGGTQTTLNGSTQTTSNGGTQTTSNGGTPSTTSAIAKNSGIGTPMTDGMTAGVTVTPEVWAQMQSLLALFPIQQVQPNTINSCPEALSIGSAAPTNLVMASNSTFLIPSLDHSLSNSGLDHGGSKDKEVKSDSNCGKQLSTDSEANQAAKETVSDSKANQAAKETIYEANHFGACPDTEVLKPVTQVLNKTLDFLKKSDFDKYDFKAGGNIL